MRSSSVGLEVTAGLGDSLTTYDVDKYETLQWGHKAVKADRRGGGCRSNGGRKGRTWSRFNWCLHRLPIVIGSRRGLNWRWRGILGLKSGSRWPRPLLSDPWRLSGSRLWVYWGFGSSFPPESVYIDFTDWSVARSNWADRLCPTGGFIMSRVFCPRSCLHTRHDHGWGDIFLISGGDNHVGSFEEAGDGSGVCGEEAFLIKGSLFSTPVDLNEFEQFGL